MRPGRSIALLVSLLLVVACGGARFDGTTYRGDGFAFRIGAPAPQWTPIAVSHAALAYRDAAADATIAVNGRCGVDGEDIPLAALTQHLFLTFTERTIVEQTTVPFDGREAMHSVITAKLDGVPKMFDVWVLKKDGCVYDLYLISEPTRHSRAAADFDRFVHGFATVQTHAD